MAQWVECLPGMYKALGSILSTVWGSGTKHVMLGGDLPHSCMAALRARCTPDSPDCIEHAPTVVSVAMEATRASNIHSK